ncbi:MAG TPA: DUF3307 domain-containing protein [Clostridiaceae bacterium]|nr:DUF3307 domain-containing protein [Clostridiaceae bacterium]
MNNIQSLILILLISHFLGDYYLQTKQMSELKGHKLKELILHFFIHLILNVGLVYISFGSRLLIIPLLISLSHLLIDFIKGKMNSKYENHKFTIYMLDQFFHICLIVLVTYLFTDISYLIFNSNINRVLNRFSINPVALLKNILVIVIIIKPASISIKLFLEKFNFEDKQLTSSAESDNAEENIKSLTNAGSTIGILERIIIYILARMSQFAAIGFVLTAKSITRYEKITKSPAFGEYYLIGTLFSFLIVILLVVIL